METRSPSVSPLVSSDSPILTYPTDFPSSDEEDEDLSVTAEREWLAELRLEFYSDQFERATSQRRIPATPTNTMNTTSGPRGYQGPCLYRKLPAGWRRNEVTGRAEPPFEGDELPRLEAPIHLDDDTEFADDEAESSPVRGRT